MVVALVLLRIRRITVALPPSNIHPQPPTVDSKKLEYRPGAIYAGFPSSVGFRVGGQSYYNFLASTVITNMAQYIGFLLYWVFVIRVRGCLLLGEGIIFECKEWTRTLTQTSR